MTKPWKCSRLSKSVREEEKLGGERQVTHAELAINGIETVMVWTLPQR